MKGVLVAVVIVLAILSCNLAMANPPLEEPFQYEQYCENQKVAGTGVVDISTSMVDKKLALEYYNVMAGDGDFELDSEHLLSENASKLLRPAANKSQDVPLNLYETTKMTYKAINAPLVGGKYLHSKSFYGGIGADIQEMFSVNEMEKEQRVFFASTDPAGHWTNQAVMNQWAKDNNLNSFQDIINATPTHLVGMDSKNSFNGTWGTDSKWHKIFYKDIKDHQMFSGNFETEKLIKFHEAPFVEKAQPPCAGVDC